jgi:ABC-type Na+ transport system ATPase subunit NatA
VFASHLLEDVTIVADRVLVIEDARVVAIEDVLRFGAAESAW